MTVELSNGLSNERAQLLETWKRVFTETPDPRHAPFLQLVRLASGDGSTKAIGDDLRKFHDRFGWMAKETSPGGKCAGALYRTKAFIQIPADKRVGKRAGQTVHIEHTVPVNVLAKRWIELRQSGRAQDLMPTFGWVMHHTVATAFEINEQKTLKGVSRSTDCFAAGTAGFDRPFKRYAGLYAQGGQVWDVYRGALVDPDQFSLDDHFGNVVALVEEAGASADFVSALKAFKPQ